MSTPKTIFKRIIDREIPAKILFEDELSLAFHDVSPQAPVHILVIPKKEIASIAELEPADAALMGHLFLVVQKIAAEQGLTNGFRTVINTGRDGGQTVNHLHIHLMGNRQLSWPPG
jgi:histidine triad (HIT) family protein